jgi:uncharacterized protein YegJ (DUF2314 family)
MKHSTTSGSIISLGALALGLALIGGSALAATTAKAKKAPAKEDEVVEVNVDDPAMKAAVKKAQATFDDFLKKVSAKNANLGNIAVRVVLRDGKKSEYVWLGPFTVLDNGTFKGTVNSAPTIVKKYQFMQVVPFTRADVVDWMYTEADTRIMRGNFTTCAQLATAPESDVKEIKKRYGLDCSAH